MQNMKEFKTLRVDPKDEDRTMQNMSQFGWILDSSQEIYNESQEIVGVEETSKATTYNSFMQGFTGNDGRVDTSVNVQTQTKVTHYIAMKFSRDQNLVDYDRLVQLEKEYTQLPVYKPQIAKTGKPLILTIVFAVSLVISVISLLQLLNGETASAVELALCIGVPVILFALMLWRWLHYKKVHPSEEAECQRINQENNDIQIAYEKRHNEILPEVNEILKANNM
jgi:heme/copper-type cytochrome/quinol oxidase subunit 4